MAAIAALAFAGALAACGGSSEAGAERGGGSVDIVAYSTPQEVYLEDLIPAFQATPEGEGVQFSTSFAGSGDSRRAVQAGQPADFVHLPTAARWSLS